MIGSAMAKAPIEGLRPSSSIQNQVRVSDEGRALIDGGPDRDLDAVDGAVAAETLHLVPPVGGSACGLIDE